MEGDAEDVRREVAALKERNARVEADKAWETSLSRAVCVSLLIYATVALALLAIGNENPFLNALIPVTGFVISLQSLPVVERKWKEWYRRRKEAAKI